MIEQTNKQVVFFSSGIKLNLLGQPTSDFLVIKRKSKSQFVIYLVCLHLFNYILQQ